MNTCKVCANIYHHNRISCPVCGAHALATGNYSVDSTETKMRELVVAKGVQDTKLRDWFRVK